MGLAVCFCGPIHEIAPTRTLSGIVLYGVRTFLQPKAVSLWASDHLADLGRFDLTTKGTPGLDKMPPFG